MSKMQAANQLPIPAADSADSANELIMPAAAYHLNPPQLPLAPVPTQLPLALDPQAQLPTAAPGNKFEGGDLFHT